MEKQWHLRQPDPEIVSALSNTLPCDPATAAVLVNRDILSPEAAHCFVNVSLNHLRSPFTLKDMDTAVRRIYKAIKGNEKILIFGDYDVDGITATVLLLDFLRQLSVEATYYIPHRITEGYGLQPRHIAEYARPGQVGLIITADCGSGSHTAVKYANEAGIDIIITDHHNISTDIPPALAVINPKRRDCPAGMDNLAGVGVAFLLLISLRKYLRDQGYWQDRPEPNLKNYCDLVALGTVADMVPLVRENRIFCKTGLRLMQRGDRPGLQALLQASAVQEVSVDADDIAFRLAPRLNAAGRIDHAAAAVNLLLAQDLALAKEGAQRLNLCNQRRQALEKTILEDIQIYLTGHPQLLRQHSLVISRNGWHPGILGIAASRTVDRYFRPVVLIATPPEGEGDIAKGSARSIPALDMYKALSACAQHLEGFGGHAQAAGLQIRNENIYAFQRAFDSVIQAMAAPEDLIPKLLIDYPLEFNAISDSLLDELESLAPFGAGNPEPLFIADSVRVVSSKIVGSHHRQMVLRQSATGADASVRAIHFNVDERLAHKDAFDQMVFRLRWNRWNGKKTAQMVVIDAS
jgi:single-stranded-DNA-specific exonuclease